MKIAEQQAKHFPQLLAEAKALEDAKVFKTEEGRTLVAMHKRLLETLIDGKPITEMPSRHHV